MIRAVTFDFWDTLFIDDSDEPKRAALGLPAKVEARTRLILDELGGSRPDLSPLAISGAWGQANAWARKQWHEAHHTPTVAVRLQRLYGLLGLRPTPGFPGLVDALEAMEVDVMPDPVPGVPALLAALARDYRVGIISDTIVTPGRGLRRILAAHGLLGLIDHCAFSDELGCSKPAPGIFLAAAEGLGVAPSELCHVGDREANDVAGPQAVGARAILYTAVKDRGSAETAADAVCADPLRLPELLRALC